MQPLIVTRHKPLVEWLRLHGVEGEVIEQATPDLVRGRDVYGVLPHYLSAECNSITEVSMPGLTVETRKKLAAGDLSVAEMDECGAHMETFIVRRQFA